MQYKIKHKTQARFQIWIIFLNLNSSLVLIASIYSQYIMQNDVHNFTKLFYSYSSYSIYETDN